MKQVAAALVVVLLTVAPAWATEWLICSNSGNTASISVLLGAMNVIAVNDIKMEVGTKQWSTTPGEGTLITRGQAFESADQMWIDITDKDMADIVARLRLFKATEGDNYASGGTLAITGEGAWPVACDGP